MFRIPKTKASDFVEVLLFGLLPLTLMMVVVGCWPFNFSVKPSITIKPPVQVGPAVPAKPQTVEQAQKELAEAKQQLQEAKQQVADKKKAYDDAVLASRQSKLHWICGICVLAMLGCVAGAIFLPGAARWFVGGAAAAAGVGATTYFLAMLLPYMTYIVVGLFVVAVIVAIYLWRRDHQGLRQVVTAVESVKAEIPDYKTKLGKFINGGVDKYVTAVREKLGLLKS